MLECLFNKVAGVQACIFVKKRLQHRCFPVNIVKFLRTPILKYICERLLRISEMQTTYNAIYILAENFIFNFGISKIFSYLLSITNFSSTEFVFALAFFLHTISNISHNNVSHSSSLYRLNVFSHYQKFALIGNAQNLSSGFI